MINMFFYKISSINPNVEVNDCYIGSTQNINQRLRNHKSNCNNEKSEKYNYKIYQYIRNNGGFENFKLTLLKQCDCNSRLDAKAIEKSYIDEYEAKLNSILPYTTIHCERMRKNNFMRNYYHENKDKINSYKSTPYTCECCNVIINTGNKARHERTQRHKNNL